LPKKGTKARDIKRGFGRHERKGKRGKPSCRCREERKAHLYTKQDLLTVDGSGEKSDGSGKPSAVRKKGKDRTGSPREATGPVKRAKKHELGRKTWGVERPGREKYG